MAILITKPYIDKLRIIQLIEAAFNTALEILSSRRLMRYVGTMEVNSTQTYGRIQCCSTYDAMIISQISNDITRLNNINVLIPFNDDDGCYGRMRPELSTSVIRIHD